MNSAMNSVPETCPEIDVGGRLSPRQLQIEQTGAGSTTACTSPRTRWRSLRARCRSGPSFLASFEARVCVSASACLLCVSASAWLSGQGSSLCVSCVVSCVRCELLAVRAQEPWRVCRLGDVTYTRFAQLGLRLRGSVRFEVRGRRVCRLRCYVCVRVCACVVSCCPACILLIVPVAAPAILSFSMRVLCVFIDLLRSPSLRRDGVDGVDCACGCARYIVFLYVCFMCVY